jgi:hypothetical protein
MEMRLTSLPCGDAALALLIKIKQAAAKGAKTAWPDMASGPTQCASRVWLIYINPTAMLVG